MITFKKRAVDSNGSVVISKKLLYDMRVKGLTGRFNGVIALKASTPSLPPDDDCILKIQILVWSLNLGLFDFILISKVLLFHLEKIN